MASRLGLTLPSMARLICPELRSALAMRAVSRTLQYVITDGVLCTLVLCDRKLANERLLDNCAAKLPCLLRDALVWGRMVISALVATLE